MTGFAKSDCVRLKAGGPTMTVIGADAGMLHRHQVRVVWIDDAGQKHERHYPAESLTHVDRDRDCANADRAPN